MKESLPAVSIIMPAYKRIDYLKEAIESALAQTFTDFEILVCDDSAEPKIAELCSSYGDPRINYRANPQNLGIAMNNFSGFQWARADLLTKLDDDDRWLPDFLEKLVPVMLADPNICLTFCDHWIIDAAGDRTLAKTEEQTTRFGRSLLSRGVVEHPQKLIFNKSIPLASSAVFRKSAIDWSACSESVGGAYDFFLSSCLVSSGRDVFYIPERLTEYRLHGGSGTSTRALQNSLETLFVSEKIYQNPFFTEIRSEYRKFCAYNCKWAANQFFKQGKALSALYYYGRSLKYILLG
jgi:glycosyltransferase involved in cell wall biosynthesis